MPEIKIKVSWNPGGVILCVVLCYFLSLFKEPGDSNNTGSITVTSLLSDSDSDSATSSHQPPM